MCRLTFKCESRINTYKVCSIIRDELQYNLFVYTIKTSVFNNLTIKSGLVH